MKESEIQKEIKDWLTAKNVVFWKTHLSGIKVRGAIRQNPMKGFPDLAGIIPDTNGRMFVIEVKRGVKEILSKEQLEWKEKLTARGVVYILAVSIADVEIGFKNASPYVKKLNWGTGSVR